MWREGLIINAHLVQSTVWRVNRVTSKTALTLMTTSQEAFCFKLSHLKAVTHVTTCQEAFWYILSQQIIYSWDLKDKMSCMTAFWQTHVMSILPSDFKLMQVLFPANSNHTAPFKLMKCIFKRKMYLKT